MAGSSAPPAPAPVGGEGRGGSVSDDFAPPNVGRVRRFPGRRSAERMKTPPRPGRGGVFGPESRVYFLVAIADLSAVLAMALSAFASVLASALSALASA